MDAGKLDRRIRIERATETRSATDGSVSLEWVLLAETWARVEPLSGREFFEAQQWAAKADTRFTVRWSSALGELVTPDETCRIVYEERAYNIRSVAELGRRIGLVIIAEARAEAPEAAA